MLYLALFARALAIVAVTAANVVFLSRGNAWAMFLSGGLLSWIWVGNSRAVVRFDRPWTREAYAAGAACGTVLGWWLGGQL